MARRRKTIYAGRMVYDVVYTMPNPRDSDAVRKEIRKMSSQAIAKTNCDTACRKLELITAANFDPWDLVVSVTFRDADLPEDYAGAQKCIRKLLQTLRDARTRRGQSLRYVYIPEGRHGDARRHFHIYLNATGRDLEEIRSLWRWGDEVDLSYVRDRGYEGWAKYFSKERREASLNGKRMFVPSMNLERPEVDYQWVDDGVTVEAPVGATEVQESADRNQYASFKFVKYMLPQPPRRRSRQHKVAPHSDLKPTVTTARARRKSRTVVDSPPEKEYTNM